jgi:hypothetical protein
MILPHEKGLGSWRARRHRASRSKLFNITQRLESYWALPTQPGVSNSAKYIAVDFLDRPALEERLRGITDITHIFFAALYWGSNFFDEVAPNLALLANTVEVVERSSPTLRKVLLVEGAKFYGAHLGPYKTPAKETDLRHMPPNFYYDQEDYLVERSAGKTWSWIATEVSGVNRDLSRHHGDDGRRTSRQSHGLGGHERSMRRRSFQHHEWRF